MIALSPTTHQLTDAAEPAPRKELEHPIMVLRVNPENERRTFFGYATNLSPGGFRIDATKPRDMGERFELEFELPGELEGEARCHCEVVWRKDWAKHQRPGMGLKFLDLPKNLATKLEAWIKDELFRDLFRPTGTC